VECRIEWDARRWEGDVVLEGRDAEIDRAEGGGRMQAGGSEEVLLLLLWVCVEGCRKCGSFGGVWAWRRTGCVLLCGKRQGDIR
jgi:hypothetical protein